MLLLDLNAGKQLWNWANFSVALLPSNFACVNKWKIGLNSQIAILQKANYLNWQLCLPALKVIMIFILGKISFSESMCYKPKEIIEGCKYMSRWRKSVLKGVLIISANFPNGHIRSNYFFGDTFVTFVSYGSPKDFIIKCCEDGFDDDDDDGDFVKLWGVSNIWKVCKLPN